MPWCTSLSHKIKNFKWAPESENTFVANHILKKNAFLLWLMLSLCISISLVNKQISVTEKNTLLFRGQKHLRDWLLLLFVTVTNHFSNSFSWLGGIHDRPGRQWRGPRMSPAEPGPFSQCSADPSLMHTDTHYLYLGDKGANWHTVFLTISSWRKTDTLCRQRGLASRETFQESLENWVAWLLRGSTFFLYWVRLPTGKENGETTRTHSPTHPQNE